MSSSRAYPLATIPEKAAAPDHTVVAPMANRARRWNASTKKVPTASASSFIVPCSLFVDEHSGRTDSNIAVLPVGRSLSQPLAAWAELCVMSKKLLFLDGDKRPAPLPTLQLVQLFDSTGHRLHRDRL